MPDKALLVDDVANVLASFQRNLRGQLEFDVADSGKAALELMSKNEYSVLVTDMQMPEMDGLTLLREVKRRYPDVVRIMLTGNGDQQTAIDAVNEGDVFRFLTKPCSVEELRKVIHTGFRQHQLLVSEKVLLNDTIKGVVSVLAEVIGLVNPNAVAQSVERKGYMIQLAKALRLKSSWTFEPMIELSQLGAILSPSVEADREGKTSLTRSEAEMLEQHAILAHDLLEQIPRFESIARNILYQDKFYNGDGFPQDDVAGEDIPLGARMLKVVNDFIVLKDGGLTPSNAVKKMESQVERYDKKVLAAFTSILFQKHDIMQISYRELDVGMVIAQPLITTTGKRIALSGQIVTGTIRQLVAVCIKNNLLNGDDKLNVFLEDICSDEMVDAL